MTDEQEQVFKAVKAEWDKRMKHELERWGNPLTTMSPFDVPELVKDLNDGRKARRIWRVLNELEDLGRLRMKHTRTSDSMLVRGEFGRGYKTRVRTKYDTTMEVL